MVKVYLVNPHGFCGGVKRAVEILDKVLEKHGKPVYVKHHLVHNKHIIKDFEKKGASFVDEVQEIPNGSIAVFSAHGSPLEDYELARKNNLVVYDATCPLVTKVHLEAKRYAKEGYFIIYIGHKNHPEPKGVLGEIPKGLRLLIDSLEAVDKIKLSNEEKIIVLSQTTLSFDETKEIIEKLKKKFVNLLLPPVFDICYATQNRQAAVKELAKKTSLILVVGSKSSSNSSRLKDISIKEGRKSYLIDDVSEIKEEWLVGHENIGITAGACAPDYLVNEVLEFFKKKNAQIINLQVIRENVIFPMLKNL